MAKSPPARNFFTDKRQAIIILHWLIIIAASYFALFSKGEVTQNPWVHAWVAIFLASALVLYRLPRRIFYHPFFDTVFVVVDTVFITAAIYMKRDVPWDLMIFYFYILFLAAFGTDMIRIVIGSVAISLVHTGLLLQQAQGLEQIGADLFMRIPFLFGVSILYGYLAENARQEKQRAEILQHREHLRMDLVSALAHDIKNPLGIIMGYTESMIERFARRKEESASLEALERIQYNSQRIVSLVTGFLEASKAEAGRLKIIKQPVCLNALLREVLQQQEWDMQKKRLGLELELDEKLPDVLGDENQFDRVFRNLVSNAIKFTPAGGTITVSSKLDDDHVEIAVKDTGIGIPQEEIPLLFTQFGRLTGSAKIEGTGLGLFIVKTIIEAYKGTVQVESSSRGTTFTVRMPLHP